MNADQLLGDGVEAVAIAYLSVLTGYSLKSVSKIFDEHLETINNKLYDDYHAFRDDFAQAIIDTLKELQDIGAS